LTNQQHLHLFLLLLLYVPLRAIALQVIIVSFHTELENLSKPLLLLSLRISQNLLF